MAPPISVSRAMRVAEFRAALRDFQSQNESILRELGMTPQRYLLLLFVKGALDGSSRPTMTELRERMKLSPNTVTELVDRVARDGLVVRDAGIDDQRVVFVRLTAKGTRAVDEAIRATTAQRREFALRFDTLARTFAAALRG
ncbi:MAG TPA: MarR family transcriptional regulator [Gaiellaceae bacterium]